MRTEATGYGAAYFTEEMLTSRGESMDGQTAVVTGSGHVAIYAIEKLSQMGATVIACSDSSGCVVDEKGLNLEVLKQINEVERGWISDYADRITHAHHVSGGSVWDVACAVVIRSSTENELDGAAATRLVRNGCIAVAEGANILSTRDAVRVFTQAGVAFGSGKAANAGGVATSAVEMQQNACWDSWTFAHTERRLQDITRAIHASCFAAAEHHGEPGNLVLGANVVWLIRVADAMNAQGLVWPQATRRVYPRPMTEPGIVVVGADGVSWDDLQTVLGVRGLAHRCQCQRYKLAPGESFTSTGPEELAARLREQTACADPSTTTSGGLIAYRDDEPVGWCALAPRPAFTGLVRSGRVPWEGRDEDRSDPTVWALTCLFTRAGHRRRGVGRALARAAVPWARGRGAAALEAYPLTTAASISEELHVGTLAAFTAAGFTEVGRPTSRRAVVRISFS